MKVGGLSKGSLIYNHTRYKKTHFRLENQRKQRNTYKTVNTLEGSDLSFIFSLQKYCLNIYRILLFLSRSFLIHHSLILKIASKILNNIYFILVSISSIDTNYNKKLHTTSSNSLLNGGYKKYSCLKYPFSYCINSFY